MITTYGNRYLMHDGTLIDAGSALAEFEAPEPSRRPLSGTDGRGTVWQCDGRFGPAVLKAYRRGGLLGRLIREDYVWTGAARCRSLAEFALTRAWSAAGLPVPRPIAAYARRHVLTYRALILTQRITAPRSLLTCMHESVQDAPWESAGRAIAELHRVGARHADLNATNVLIDAEGKTWVIDWDKARDMRCAGAWMDEGLQRLRRGLLKHRRQVPIDAVESGFQRLRVAHDEALRP